MRWVWLIVGVLALGAGVVFTLQGIGILKGSVMTGSQTWAILGPIIALVGVILLVVGARRQGA